MDSNNPFGAETAARGGQSADIGYKNIQSDVNLYRGNLSFPVVLANLDGRDGLGFSSRLIIVQAARRRFIAAMWIVYRRWSDSAGQCRFRI